MVVTKVGVKRVTNLPVTVTNNSVTNFRKKKQTAVSSSHAIIVILLSLAQIISFSHGE